MSVLKGGVIGQPVLMALGPTIQPLLLSRSQAASLTDASSNTAGGGRGVECALVSVG